MNDGHRSRAFAALAILAVGLVAAVVVSNTLLQGVRIDLTENNLYTISEGTENILESIEEPINLYFFFSDVGTADVAGLRTYANRVREMLTEFEAAAGGQLVVTEIDPQPFSEEEDRASQYGLQAVTLGPLSESIYFGLAGTNSVGDEETIAFFQPDKESFLEYDLAKLISALATPKKTTVGLVAGVSMTVGFDPQTQQMREPWVVTEQARQLFELRTLAAGFDRVEEDVDILWVVQPKALPPASVYAIDQFVLAGGKAIIFVDPLAEIDAAAQPGMPPGMAMAQGSDIPELFEAWGLEFSANEVVADDRYALTVRAGDGRPVRHLGLIGIDAEAFDTEDVITATLSNMNFGVTGHFTTADDSPLTLEPLVTSSSEAALLPADRFRFLADPGTLADEFEPTGKRYVLAARASGELQTAFPDGPPPVEPTDDGVPTAPRAEHLAASTAPANLILVGDVDVLSDRLWVQVQNFFGQRIPTAFANNGDFAINALENFSGSADLIRIRSRATAARPFTTVEALRREADAQFRTTEQQLQAELSDTEARLEELQSARADDATALFLSAEQQAELDRFIDRRTEIRQELRAVQRNLNRDIENLGTRLKVMNIGLMPLLVIIAGVVILLGRRSRASR